MLAVEVQKPEEPSVIEKPALTEAPAEPKTEPVVAPIVTEAPIVEVVTENIVD